MYTIGNYIYVGYGMKIKMNLILVLVLVILLVGCDNVAKDIKVFNDLFNNNNYAEAIIIYEENKDDDEFLKAVTVSINDTIENIKVEFNNETHNFEETNTNVESIKEFIPDDVYNQIIKYIDELYESKNNFSNAQEKEKLLDYDSALMYYGKVIESDINYSIAQDNIKSINEKIAESYKQFVISMKDKVEVEIDDIVKLYNISYALTNREDIVLKEPYAGVLRAGIVGEFDKDDSISFKIYIARLVPSIVGEFKEVIFYQKTTENVEFTESDMPVQLSTDPNWINMYGKEKLACVYISVISSENNINDEKFNGINDMLNNEDEEIIIRMYNSNASSVDINLKSDEREKIKEVFKLYKALKYDKNLISELI